MSEKNLPKKSNNMDYLEKILVFLSLSIYGLLIPPFFKNQTLAGHDVGAHLNYLRIFTDALSQGQFPVRWIEWGSLGQNQPLFSFYQPMLYYLSQIPHLLGADILNSLYQTVLFLWLFSGFITFLFVKNLTKSTLAGLVASCLYVFAPYHIVDVFVRTAYPEVTALAFAPGLFYALERYFATKKAYYLAILALFFAAVFISHPPTLIMFAFPFAFYLGFLLWDEYNKGIKLEKIVRKTLNVVLGIVLGFGLASFFAIPAFLQQNLIKSPSLNVGYLDFHNHYACLMQLVIPMWGYGTSVQGCTDQMPFQLGIINWIIILASISLLIYYFKKKIHNPNKALVLTWLATAFFGLYMTLSFSQPFWEGIPYLSFLQFTWRFLSISIFAVSVLGGLLFLYVKKREYKLGLFAAIILATPLLVFTYLQPAQYLPRDYFVQDSPDFYKGLGQVQKQDTAELGYMPKYVQVLPISDNIPSSEIQAVDSKGELNVIKNTFTHKEYELKLDKPSRIVLFVHYFPGWKVTLNGNEVKPDYSNIYGFIYLIAPAGESHITANFENTTLITLSNLLSLISFFIVIAVFIFSKGKLNFSKNLPTSREEI